MANLIFVGGLDNRPGDKNIDEQAALVKKGYGTTADIISFRYSAADAKVLAAIDSNPGIPIMLFSAGCAKSKTIANKLKANNQPLNLLHINEPYTCSANTEAIVKGATDLGVPKSNVFSGGDPCTGSNMPGATKLKDRKNHFQSLTPMGEFIFKNFQSTPPTTQQQTPTGTQSDVIVASQSAYVEPRAASSSDIFGKMFLKKKSGPGEITGVAEVQIETLAGEEVSNFEFKDIQFTDPGDYVITISSESEFVRPLDVKIKVNPAPEIVAQQEKTDSPPAPVTGNRPIIAQIDQPTIKLPPISMPQDRTTTPGGQNVVTDGLGFTPVVEYGGNFIKVEDIVRLSIFHEGIVPKFDMTFRDSLNLMKGDGTPQDQTNIQVFLNSSSPHIKSIHMVFKIENFDKEPEKSGQKYRITGTLNIPDLYIQNNKSYTGTSFEAIRTICKELGLGFNSNITNTDDSMNWRNPNKRPYEFITDIVKHSYISDESYMVGYIDHYYCFNYVDVNKEFTRNIGADVVIDTSPAQKKGSKSDDERIVPLVLTNDKSNSSSSLYFTSYTTENNSTEISLEEGYKTRTKFYDRIKKTFLVFDVDSQTTDGKQSLIMKGAQNDTQFFNTNIITKFLGKLDTDNTHKNYNYAFVQNQINLRNMTKLSLNLTLNNPNFCLYKFMKVKVAIMNPSATPTEEMMNYRYSGDYWLNDISYVFERSMRQEVKLFRSELGKSREEMKNPPANTPQPDPKQNNENPAVPGTTASVATNLPNSVYNPGEVYVVQDESGKKFRITVKQVLSNGTEIIGTLEEI